VDQASAVRVLERGEGIGRHGGCGFDRQPGPTGESLTQGAAVDVLHDEEGASGIDAEVVDRHDVGVREPRDVTRLAFEPDLGSPVGRMVLGQHLYGYRPAQPVVEAPPHDGHASVPDHLEEPIAAAQQRPGPPFHAWSVPSGATAVGSFGAPMSYSRSRWTNGHGTTRRVGESPAFVTTTAPRCP
jgi:hypothetical protein